MKNKILSSLFISYRYVEQVEKLTLTNGIQKKRKTPYITNNVF